MSEKTLIAVCGATGQQGRAVVSSLLARQTFAVRGLSRQPDGDAARRLRDQGEALRETRALVPDAWGLPEYLRQAS